MSAFFESLRRIPAVAFNFSEEGIVHHHARAAGLVVLQLHKLAIAKFLLPFGQVFGNDVGVDVDREKILGRKHATKVHRFPEMTDSVVFSLLYKHPMSGSKQRNVDLFGATSIVVANMIGTGVFTSLGYQLFDIQSGFGIVMIWLVGGLLALCGAFCYAELATRLPEDGGEYYFLSKIYHPALGFVAGFVSSTVGFAAPIAGASIALGAYVHGVWPGVNETALAIIIITLISIIHWWNARLGIDFQKGSTVLKVSMILLFIGAGFAIGQQPVDFLPSAQSWKEIFGDGKAASDGWLGLGNLITPAFATSLIWVSFAYSGWNASTYIAGSIENPNRNLSRSILMGTLTVTGLYVLLNMVLMKSTAVHNLVGVKEVGLVAAEALLGSNIGKLMGGIISLLLVSTISSMVFTGPRVLAKMFETIPSMQGLSKREADGNPRRAIVVQWVVSLILLFVMDFPQLIYYIAFTLSLFTMLTVLGMMILRFREGKPDGYRAWGYPVTPILFLLTTGAVAMFFVNDKPTESLYGLSTAAVGFVFYLLSKRK
jgi:APA family basic amino acid/polyamine antiporter